MTAATKGAKRRSAEERIAALQKRESQLKARRKALEARARQQERKRRTRQLIQLGGVLAAWGFDTPEQVEGLLREVTVSAAGRRRLAAWGCVVPGAGRRRTSRGRRHLRECGRGYNSWGGGGTEGW